VRDVDDKCPTVAGDPALAGCPAYKQVTLKDDRLVIKEKVFFFHNATTIDARSHPLLQEVAQLLKDRPSMKVRIEGHTDASGKEAHNQKLSQARADAVRAYLLENGVAAARVEARGFGSQKPIDSNNTLEGRENNRRVDFVVVQQ